MYNLFRKNIFSKATLVLLSLASISLTGCMDDDLETPEPTPVTYVSFYHGSPDAPDMDIQLNNQTINSQAFKYSLFSDYVALKPGSRSIKFTPVNAATAYIDSTMDFKEGKAYSLFAINKLENIELLAVQDSVKQRTTGKVALRVINLSPDAPAIDVKTAGATGTALASDLTFKGVTPFIEFDGGKYTVQVKSADSDAVLLTVTDLNLLAGTTYTLIIRGFATPPSGNTNALAAQLIKNY